MNALTGTVAMLLVCYLASAANQQQRQLWQQSLN